MFSQPSQGLKGRAGQYYNPKTSKVFNQMFFDHRASTVFRARWLCESFQMLLLAFKISICNTFTPITKIGRHFSVLPVFLWFYRIVTRIGVVTKGREVRWWTNTQQWQELPHSFGNKQLGKENKGEKMQKKANKKKWDENEWERMIKRRRESVYI